MENNLLQLILDMVYPVRCPVCGDIVIPKTERICIPCKEKLVYIKEPRCKKCSKPIEEEEQEYCIDCMHKNFQFVKGFSVWLYDSTMKQSMIRFKYHSKKEFGVFYIQEMSRIYGNAIKKLSPDAIVPVPIHHSKYLDRGYNQADILAKGLGRELDLPVLSHLLVRNRKTLPQKKLSDKERLRNLQEAFELNKKVYDHFPKELNNILIIDDIYTTGSTIEACTNVLMKYGIGKVYFITVCIGKGF